MSTHRGALNNLIIAHAQVWGFLLTGFGIYSLIVMVVMGYAHLDSTTEKLVYTMFGFLGGKYGDMVSYMYNRQRPDSSSVFTPAKQPAHPTEPVTPASS